jgi:hypothetical protein
MLCHFTLTGDDLEHIRLACAVSAVNLEHILRQTQPDCDNPRHTRSRLWIIGDPPWHIDSIGMQLHHKNRLNGTN